MNLFILFCFQCCPPDICCNWSEHCLDSGCCYGQRKVTHCCTRESVYKSWPSKRQCKAGGSACCCSWSYCRCQVRERQVKIFTSPWKQKLWQIYNWLKNKKDQACWLTVYLQLWDRCCDQKHWGPPHWENCITGTSNALWCCTEVDTCFSSEELVWCYSVY